MCDICWPGNGGKYVASANTNTVTVTNPFAGLCYACLKRYDGEHTCSVHDLNKRIEQLTALRDGLGYAALAKDPWYQRRRKSRA